MTPGMLVDARSREWGRPRGVLNRSLDGIRGAWDFIPIGVYGRFGVAHDPWGWKTSHWTLVDDSEWEFGWSLRFGLIALDVQTRERRPRRSAELFHVVATTNTLTGRMVRQYAPEAWEEAFRPVGSSRSEGARGDGTCAGARRRG